MTRTDRIGMALCLVAIGTGIATLLTDQWPAAHVLAGFNILIGATILNLILRAVIRTREDAPIAEWNRG